MRPSDPATWFRPGQRDMGTLGGLRIQGRTQGCTATPSGTASSSSGHSLVSRRVPKSARRRFRWPVATSYLTTKTAVVPGTPFSS